MKHLIGHKVEDFKVQAYHQGDFKEVTLQDTKGHCLFSFSIQQTLLLFAQQN